MDVSPPFQHWGENKGGKKELLLATHLSLLHLHLCPKNGHWASLEPCMECVMFPPYWSPTQAPPYTAKNNALLQRVLDSNPGVGLLVARKQCPALFRFSGTLTPPPRMPISHHTPSL